jgi:hypothetical protein
MCVIFVAYFNEHHIACLSCTFFVMDSFMSHNLDYLFKKDSGESR